MDLVLLGRSDRREPIDFVKEDDRGLSLLGLLEEKPELPLCLAHPLGETVSAFPIRVRVRVRVRTHLERQSAPLRMKKATGWPVCFEQTLARTLAMSVFPVPGGP